MRSGFRLGKLFGIQIRVDWSWLVIFLLTSWNLSTSLGEVHSEWSAVVRWSVAVIAALLFFASVLAHELAHSLVAQSQGMAVRSIRLHLFGGVSNIQREPDSPKSEFVMAILGPVTSLVIGSGLLLIVGMTTNLSGISDQSAQTTLSRFGPFKTVLVWLGSVNLTLGIFNLIPGFPLDGGRVLRSILWAITGHLRRATRWASWVGRAISWLMIFAGIAMAFGTDIFGGGVANGLWLTFIGWFLHNAAVQSYRQMVIRDVLEEVSINEVMQRDPDTVQSDRTVGHLVHDCMMQSDDHAFPVVDDDHLVGIVTLDDVRSVPRDDWSSTYVREIMTPAEGLVTVTPDEDASRPLDQLAGRDVRQLPVLEEGRLVGLVRRRDIVKWLQLQSEFNPGVQFPG
jgi:Zn-dependent protease